MKEIRFGTSGKSKVTVSKAKLWSAIRKQCLECMGGSFTEVEACTSPNCSLYPYRFGKPISAIQKLSDKSQTRE
jgi:hypothetical protein